MNNQENIIENLIAKSLSGETTVVEETQLQKWIAESPANEKLYLDLKKALRYGQKHYESDSTESLNINISSEWTQFLSNARIKQETKTVSFNQKKTNSTGWLKMAAAIVLIAGIGFVINYFVDQPSTIQYQTAEITQDIMLPDGSTVILNKHSSLSYLKGFGNVDRQVELNGEAFFDVVKDKKKPFIIGTQNARVHVLGTSFNVRATKNNRKTEVVVATGVVKLLKKETDESITLNVGDKGVLSEEKLFATINDDINFLSWKTGKIIFVESELATVIETLNRAYNINIDTSVDIPQTCEVTVTFEQQSIESIMNVLKTTLDLEFTINDDKIEITDIGC